MGNSQDLAIALARDANVVAFARTLAQRCPGRGRLSRIAGVFTFVSHLVDAPTAGAKAPVPDEAPAGVDLFLRGAGPRHGPAVILCALLQALGERASVERTRELTFVRVEVGDAELRRLPPHTGLIATRGRLYLPLDPRRCRSPLGFLPRVVREALRKRGPSEGGHWRKPG